MSNIINPLVEDYIRKIIPKNTGILSSMEEYAHRHHVPIVQPEVAKLLEVITKTSGAKKILEIGTAIGYSAIVFCQAMESGSLISIERRRDMIQLATAYIKEAGYEGQIKILHGSAEDMLPTLNESFDMIFMDAAKGQYRDFLNLCAKLLSSRGILVCDNVLYQGMIASDEYVVRRKRTIVNRMRSYLDYIMDHPDYVSCIIPIGDGVTISYKR